MKTIEKNTIAVLDYKFIWDPWLAISDYIVDHTITLPDNLTLTASAITDSGRSITVWLSGGSIDESYEVQCAIETKDGRTDKRSILIQMTNR